MGRAAFDHVRPFANSGRYAAAIISDTGRSLHTGILFREGDTTIKVIHLGLQDQLYCGAEASWTWRKLWAAPQFEPERLRNVAALCRRIFAKFEISRTFPYGLGLGVTFDAAGSMVVEPGARGATCATFVLAVFKSVGLDLIQEDTWDARPTDDRAWLTLMRERRIFQSPSLIAALEAEIAGEQIRVRPEEVVGACTRQPPVGFKKCLRAAKIILQLLKSGEEGFWRRLCQRFRGIFHSQANRN